MLHTAKKGFTLIELLIVVVIIGILAAIAIPKFSNTKDKAKLASVKTDIRNYMTAQEAYFSDNQTYGAYATLSDPSGNYKFALSAGNAGADNGTIDEKGYGIEVTNASISNTNMNSCKVSVGQGAANDGVIQCP
jgi:prepilin-type N-terminal cleavage/methylation domain-containing protein